MLALATDFGERRWQWAAANEGEDFGLPCADSLVSGERLLLHGSGFLPWSALDAPPRAIAGLWRERIAFGLAAL